VNIFYLVEIFDSSTLIFHLVNRMLISVYVFLHLTLYYNFIFDIVSCILCYFPMLLNPTAQ
jgi:hypothetical protein